MQAQSGLSTSYDQRSEFGKIYMPDFLLKKKKHMKDTL